ncbi:hypothetical protein DFS34DRAFT_589715 [Phlyctochytrium arcticum]|nr:hypothetical protein DFS34DRAFT_589715 [Phlyctochytrium arcticum]
MSQIQGGNMLRSFHPDAGDFNEHSVKQSSYGRRRKGGSNQKSKWFKNQRPTDDTTAVDLTSLEDAGVQNKFQEHQGRTGGTGHFKRFFNKFQAKHDRSGNETLVRHVPKVDLEPVLLAKKGHEKNVDLRRIVHSRNQRIVELIRRQSSFMRDPKVDMRGILEDSQRTLQDLGQSDGSIAGEERRLSDDGSKIGPSHDSMERRRRTQSALVSRGVQITDIYARLLGPEWNPTKNVINGRDLPISHPLQRSEIGHTQLDLFEVELVFRKRRARECRQRKDATSRTRDRRRRSASQPPAAEAAPTTWTAWLSRWIYPEDVPTQPQLTSIQKSEVELPKEEEEDLQWLDKRLSEFRLDLKVDIYAALDMGDASVPEPELTAELSAFPWTSAPTRDTTSAPSTPLPIHTRKRATRASNMILHRRGISIPYASDAWSSEERLGDWRTVESVRNLSRMPEYSSLVAHLFPTSIADMGARAQSVEEQEMTFLQSQQSPSESEAL